MSQKEIKNQLINLYLYLKIRKADDIENITKKDIQNEKISSDIIMRTKMMKMDYYYMKEC